MALRKAARLSLNIDIEPRHGGGLALDAPAPDVDRLPHGSAPAHAHVAAADESYRGGAVGMGDEDLARQQRVCGQQLTEGHPLVGGFLADAQRLADAAAPALGRLIDDIARTVQNATSLETLQTDLVDAYGHLDTDELTRVMALAYAAAELAGMFEVRQEAGDA